MPWFRCLIEGENFPGALIRRKGLVGFYTTRWIEASSAEEAEISALEALRAEPMFKVENVALSLDAKVYFTEIFEVDGPAGVNSGATWFAMDS